MPLATVIGPAAIPFPILFPIIPCIDLYRRAGFSAVLMLPAIQFLWVNSHQLFPIGLAVQGAFLIHLVLVHISKGWMRISSEDRHLPIWPVFWALLGSVLVCFSTPLGIEIVKVTSQTLGSVAHHREHVQAFAPFYRDGYIVFLVSCAASLALFGLWRRRFAWQPFELFLWLIGLSLLAAAMRGTAFFVIISCSLAVRAAVVGSLESDRQDPGVFSRYQMLARIGCAMLTIVFSSLIVYMRWIAPSRILGGTQPGIGLALGVWPEASLQFLKRNPPPGKMLNLTWYSGNFLLYELFPQHLVFVDPRFEAYPRDFLLEVIRAEKEPELLQSLIKRYQPDWMIFELRQDSLRRGAAELIRTGDWRLVFLDTVLIVLVRDAPENQHYLTKHGIDLDELDPPGWLEEHPDLLVLQKTEMASFYSALGLEAKARELASE